MKRAAGVSRRWRVVEAEDSRHAQQPLEVSLGVAASVFAHPPPPAHAGGSPADQSSDSAPLKYSAVVNVWWTVYSVISAHSQYSWKFS